MLNNTATRPRELESHEAVDFSKVATFYRQRARCHDAAARAARGHVSKAYATEAAKLWRCAEIAEDLHQYDVANPRD